MRFPGELGRAGPRVAARLRLRGSPLEIGSPLLIDTGSTTTLLAVHDARRLGVRGESLPASRARTLSFGGPVREARLRGLVVRLDSLSGAAIGFPMGEVKVQLLPAGPPRLRRDLARVPSVLGMDFLRQFAMRLVVDCGDRSVCIESGNPAAPEADGGLARPRCPHFVRSNTRPQKG